MNRETNEADNAFKERPKKGRFQGLQSSGKSKAQAAPPTPLPTASPKLLLPLVSPPLLSFSPQLL